MQQALPAYSTLFSCLHDEQSPSVPAWTHHSIFRSVEYRDVTLRPLEKPVIHDFAVIWDDDHDERIIAVIEQIYMAGLLSPIQFIGEHKGTLTAIIAAKAYYGMDMSADEYAKRVADVVMAGAQDSWPLVLGIFDRSDSDIRTAHQTDLKQIIGVDARAEHTFFLHLDSVWKLGTKPFSTLPQRPFYRPFSAY